MLIQYPKTLSHRSRQMSDIQRKRMRTIAKFALMASVFGLVAFAPSARAALIFSLNQDGCTGSCGTPPFATVTLTQTTAMTVTVTEVLKAGEGFVATGAG